MKGRREGYDVRPFNSSTVVAGSPCEVSGFSCRQNGLTCGRYVRMCLARLLWRWSPVNSPGEGSIGAVCRAEFQALGGAAGGFALVFLLCAATAALAVVTGIQAPLPGVLWAQAGRENGVLARKFQPDLFGMMVVGGPLCSFHSFPRSTCAGAD